MQWANIIPAKKKKGKITYLSPGKGILHLWNEGLQITLPDWHIFKGTPCSQRKNLALIFNQNHVKSCRVDLEWVKVLSFFFFQTVGLFSFWKKNHQCHHYRHVSYIFNKKRNTHCVHRTRGTKATVCRRLLKAAAYRIPPPGNSDDWPPVSAEHWSICKLHKAKGHDFKSVQCSKTQGNFFCFSLCTLCVQWPEPFHRHLEQLFQRWWKPTRLYRCIVWGTSSWVRQAGNDKKPFQTARMFSFNCLSQLFYSRCSFLAGVCDAARSLYISHLL